MGSALSNVLNACSRWEQPPGIFFVQGLGGRREVVAPLTTAEVGGGGRPPRPVPLGQGVPWGGNAVAHLARACWDSEARGHHFGGAEGNVWTSGEGPSGAREGGTGGRVEASSGVCSPHGLHVAAEDEPGASGPQEGGGQRHVPMSPGVKGARYTVL